MSLPLRQDARILVAKPALIETKDGRRLEAKLLDISESGARVELEAPVTEPNIRLHWRPVPGVPAITFEGTVHRNRGAVTALRFKKLPLRELFFLRAIIRHQRGEGQR